MYKKTIHGGGPHNSSYNDPRGFTLVPAQNTPLQPPCSTLL